MLYSQTRCPYLIDVQQPVESVRSLRRSVDPFTAQVVDISSNEAHCEVSNLPQVDVFCERHSPGVYLQYLQTGVPVWYGALDHALEPARAVDSGIDRIEPVCRSNHYHLPPVSDSVEQSKQLRHNPPRHLGARVSIRGDRIDFVDEYYRRLFFLGVLEEVPQGLLCRAHAAPYYLWGRDRVKCGLCLSSERTSKQTLARPRLPI